ncbi:transposase [Streptomyces phaeochromogenes]
MSQSSSATRRYSGEYKRDAIELVRSSGRTVTEVARELGISSESLRGWVKKARAAQEAEAGAELSGPGGDTRDEELKRLRKLTAEQAKTIEILKKAPRGQAARGWVRVLADDGCAGGQNTVIAKELRVSVRSVERWHRSWREGGQEAPCTSGPAKWPKADISDFAMLESLLLEGAMAQGLGG